MQFVKAIFVGDEPNKGAKSRIPFIHARCAARLQEWIDYLVDDGDYIIVNQSDVTEFDLLDLAANYPSTPMIALGTKASSKLGRFYHFKLPHPSGRNRQLNNKAALFLKLRECKTRLG